MGPKQWIDLIEKIAGKPLNKRQQRMATRRFSPSNDRLTAKFFVELYVP